MNKAIESTIPYLVLEESGETLAVFLSKIHDIQKPIRAPRVRPMIVTPRSGHLPEANPIPDPSPMQTKPVIQTDHDGVIFGKTIT